jgi:hypothetical protein
MPRIAGTSGLIDVVPHIRTEPTGPPSFRRNRDARAGTAAGRRKRGNGELTQPLSAIANQFTVTVRCAS